MRAKDGDSPAPCTRLDSTALGVGTDPHTDSFATSDAGTHPSTTDSVATSDAGTHPSTTDFRKRGNLPQAPRKARSGSVCETAGALTPLTHGLKKTARSPRAEQSQKPPRSLRKAPKAKARSTLMTEPKPGSLRINVKSLARRRTTYTSHSARHSSLKNDADGKTDAVRQITLGLGTRTRDEQERRRFGALLLSHAQRKLEPWYLRRQDPMVPSTARDKGRAVPA